MPVGTAGFPFLRCHLLGIYLNPSDDKTSIGTEESNGQHDRAGAVDLAGGLGDGGREPGVFPHAPRSWIMLSNCEFARLADFTG
jgi:hypothetical protein